MLQNLFFLIGFLAFTAANHRLEERFTWNKLDWHFHSEHHKNLAIKFKQYVPEHALPVGVERWYNKLFVTVPRWKDGIPATLNYIDLEKHQHGHNVKLLPFPDWDSNRAGNCKFGLTTVYRIHVDRCGRLWALDAGTVGIGKQTRHVCPFALNVFDVSTGKRLRRHLFHKHDIKENTFIANLAVDIGETCDDAHAYFSDEQAYGLITYSWEKDKSWRFSHGFFYPDPLRGDFNVGGLNFQWYDEGISSLTLSPTYEDGYRNLYFSPLASHRQFAVSTRVLQNYSRIDDSYQEFIALNERGDSGHVTAHASDENGILLFNLIDQNALGCWNSKFPYEQDNCHTLATDAERLIFPSDVTIDHSRTVWVLSNKLPIFIHSELDFSDVNFRIFTAPLDHLLAGTKCDVHYKPESESEVKSENVFRSQWKDRLPPPFGESLHNRWTRSIAG